MKKIIFMICIIVILAHVLYAEDYNTTCIGTAIYVGQVPKKYKEDTIRFTDLGI